MEASKRENTVIISKSKRIKTLEHGKLTGVVYERKMIGFMQQSSESFDGNVQTIKLQVAKQIMCVVLAARS